MHLEKRFFQEPQESFFLFGPRGTGKSTLMSRHRQEAIWIDLLLPDQERAFLSNPERLLGLLEAQPNKKKVVIDEVQKVPMLLSVVHSIIEKKLGYQFILTGSSARKLKRTGADLLGGRALKRVLHPFMAGELGARFKLESALQNGLLPLLTDAINKQDKLEAYVALYLKEEIQTEGLVRNIGSFSRFLESISFSHGSLINITNISRECQVNRKTVENYVEILKDLLLAFELNIFTKRAKRDLSVHPKFYLFDAGVFRTLRPKGLLDRITEIEGAALEGLVAEHLRAWNDYSTEKHELAFWRTRSGVEVDFIVYGPLGFWAIEVKNSKRIDRMELQGLKAFLEDYPMAQAIFLYRGDERMVEDGILCLPCEEFLLGLTPDQGVVPQLFKP